MLCCLVLADPLFGGNGIADLISDSDARRAGAEHHHAEVPELLLADVQAGQDSGERHAAGALNVVIEAGYTRSV